MSSARSRTTHNEPFEDHLLLTALDGELREDLVRALVESSQDSIKILDMEGRLLSMNRSGRRLMELDAQHDWLRRDWLDFWPASHRESVREALDLARRGQGGRFEAYRTTAKGRPTWWDVVVSPVFNEFGDPQHLLAIARDITERKRASEAVRYVAEASLVVAESLDYDKTVSNIASVLIPDLADWCAIDLVSKEGTVGPSVILHSDPKMVELAEEMRRRYPPDPHADTGTPYVLRTGESQVISHISLSLLESATRSSEHLEMARSLGLHSFAAVPLKARGKTLGAFVIVSAKSERIYTEEDLPLLEELGRIGGLAVDNARLYRSAHAELNERRRVEERLRELNDMLEGHIAERTAELRKTNEHLTDQIGERERAEVRLEESNRRLRARNRELQEFADAASHDLKEPLRKISSFADLISTEFGDRLPDQVHTHLDRIQHASIRTSELIRDLLSYSRVETETGDSATVALNGLVQEVLVDLEDSIEEAGATIDVDDLPVVLGDHAQLRQLFQNLITNAIKFRNDDEAPRVHISAEHDNGGATWRISIADNGIGFDGQYAERIFAPFQRLHEKGTYPGTGMGLAICRRIVERHRGEISALSTDGNGATFAFTLPAVTGKDA